MASDATAARDILAGFIADVHAGKHSGDTVLAAVLLEHLLLQDGYKIVSRIQNERVLRAGLLGTTPEDIWAEMWDAAGLYDTPEVEDYTPA